MKYKFLNQMLLCIVLLCLVIFPFDMASGQSSQTARVGFFEPFEIPLDSSMQIPVEIENVEELYAIDFQMTFDPAILSAEDADPSMPGIQIAQAEFLDPGMVLFNEVNNTEGTIKFVTSQINPSEAKSGSGILFVIYFKGIKEGTSNLTITNLQLATREGNEIPSSKAEAVITVAENAPAIEYTPIPVHDPTNIILLQVTPHVETTQVTTVSPSIEATQSKAAQESKTEPTTVTPQSVPESTTKQTKDEQSFGFSLVKYWWIVLIVVMLVIGMGIYLIRTRKVSQ